MSVRVNLLPRDVQHRAAAGRQRAAIAAGFGLLVIALGAVWFWQGTQLDDAEAELAAEEQELQRLQGEERALGEFRELDSRRAAAAQTLQAALGGEFSLAGILQDVAAVMPTDVELETMTFSYAAEPTVTLGDLRPALGTLAFTGRTISGHAPGLERLLIELDKVAAFADVYFSNSTLEVIENFAGEVVAFSVEVDLGPEVLTGRYVDGLPEALR